VEARVFLRDRRLPRPGRGALLSVISMLSFPVRRQVVVLSPRNRVPKKKNVLGEAGTPNVPVQKKASSATPGR
jgi:hypothetical protein